MRLRIRSRRVAAVVATGLAAIGIGTGVAFARSDATPIGTGVVVIQTRLGYQAAAAAGTGMVLTSSGEVLTNNHVIRGATTIRIVVPGTTHSYTARVVGYDVADDVALLKAVGASNLETVTPGASSSAGVGDAVSAVGNAGGTGTLTSASGSITGVHRSIVVSDEQRGTARLTDLIETDADVEPGDSGGPLFNSAGRVIGMNTAASTGYVFRTSAASDSYAIPIARALSIVRKIEAGQASARIHVGATAFLGVQLQSTDGQGGFSTSGALVAGVVSGGPAASAGLAPGDVITAIDGRAITSSTSISSYILTRKPRTRITITYVDQSGATRTTRATLASGPPQ